MAFASAKFSFFELVVLCVEFELDVCKLGATLSGLEQGQRLLDMIQGIFSHCKPFQTVFFCLENGLWVLANPVASPAPLRGSLGILR